MTVAATPRLSVARAVSQAIVTVQPGDNVCLGEFTKNSGLIGGTNPEAFTRTSDQTLVDFEGLLKTIPSGIPARPGARVVTNTFATTDEQWVEVGGATIVSGGGWDDETVFTGFGTSGADRGNMVDESGDMEGHYWTGSIEIKGAGGDIGKKVIAQWTRGTGGTPPTVEQLVITLTDEFVRYSPTTPSGPGLASNSNINLRLYGNSADNADGCIVKNVMAEIVTGQTNQNPSEFVTGTEYFDYENGNTVDANGVVTEAQGGAIPESTFKGIQLELAATNVLTYSSGLSNWATTLNVIPTDNAIFIGDIPLTEIDEGTNAGQHYCRDSSVVPGSWGSGTAASIQFILKDHPTSGNGWAFISLRNFDTDYYNFYFNLSTGAFGTTADAAGIFQTRRAEEIQSGVWKVEVTIDAGTPGGQNILVSIGMATADGTNNYGGSDNILYAGGVQVEETAYCTSLIQTEGSSASRAATDLSIDTTGVFRVNNFWSIMAIKFNRDSSFDDGNWDPILVSRTDLDNALFLYRNNGAARFTIIKRIAATTYSSSVDALGSGWIANDTLIVAFRISSTNGQQCWLKNATDDSAITNDSVPNTNTDDAVLGTIIDFNEDNLGGASNAFNIKYFQTYFGDVPDSIIEAKINELAALYG